MTGDASPKIFGILSIFVSQAERFFFFAWLSGCTFLFTSNIPGTFVFFCVEVLYAEVQECSPSLGTNHLKSSVR